MRELLKYDTPSGISDCNKSEKDQLYWTSDLEVSLFYSMVGHKPVGPNRFFQMYFVHQNFCSLICKDVDVSVIWKKLETMYDLATLDESESVTTKGEIFSLPSTFGDLMENANLGLTGKELSLQKSIVESKDNDTEITNIKIEETEIKKEEVEIKNNVTLPKGITKLDSSVILETFKPVTGKREGKESKKGQIKEKDKKDTNVKKDIQDIMKGDTKESSSKKDVKEIIKEIVKKKEKMKREQIREYKKKPKKDQMDKKFGEQPRKDSEGKKTEFIKKSDSKLESSKPTRVETLKREAQFEKRKEPSDKKAENKHSDKKLEINKNIDKKNELNKSIDKNNDHIKNSDRKTDVKGSERKSDGNRNIDKKNDLNKSAEKKTESNKKVDKKLEKFSKTPDSGSNSAVKSPDMSGKFPDTAKKIKEKKDSDGEKLEKESISLKRLRDSWSSDDTPVKRPKGRPTRNSGEAVIKSTPINTGKRRRL